MIEINLNIDGKDSIYVDVKDGIKFNGVVASIQITNDEFIIRGTVNK